MTKTPKPLTRALARKVLRTVDAGLCKGLGTATPGNMCVEAAVCYAYGLPHSDDPPCVGAAVRSFKIALNDQPWASNAARAQGMRALAIAQLGSNQIYQAEFFRMLQEGTIRVIVPMALRAAASVASVENAAKLRAAADVCEQEGTVASARAANAANADADAAAAADADAAAANAAAYAYADAAAAAANAAAYAANAAIAAYAAYAANAAAAAAYAANANADAAADEVRCAAADVALQCLYALGSPGCEYLDLLS